MVPASGPVGTASAKAPRRRPSGVMTVRAMPRTCSARVSGTVTCWPVAWAKSQAWTRNSIDEDARRGRRGKLAGTQLDVAVQPAAVPGFESGLGRRGQPGLQGGRGGFGVLGAGQAADAGDRPDQVVGQVGHGEIRADGRAAVVAGRTPRRTRWQTARVASADVIASSSAVRRPTRQGPRRRARPPRPAGRGSGSSPRRGWPPARRPARHGPAAPSSRPPTAPA